MIRSRLLVVIAGVTCACVVVGAIAGVVCAALFLVASGGFRDLLLGAGPVYAYAAAVGGVSGLVLGPLATFGFLRHVPIGRLFLEGGAATALAGLLGLYLNLSVPGTLGLAAAGFLAAGARLAVRYRGTASRAASTAGR